MSVKREKGHHAVFIPVSFTKATVALNHGIQLLVQRKRGEVDIQIVWVLGIVLLKLLTFEIEDYDCGNFSDYKCYDKILNDNERTQKQGKK